MNGLRTFRAFLLSLIPSRRYCLKPTEEFGGFILQKFFNRLTQFWIATARVSEWWFRINEGVEDFKEALNRIGVRMKVCLVTSQRT
jgi:hypothetical protein